MKKLMLLKDIGSVREYKIGDGRIITIDISDDSTIAIQKIHGVFFTTEN
ncbi:MAG: hypothetical protein GY834_12720 [Bacteroidetes bacterium]|nr:hypothetical protein [Bacteroidota bacterium]